MAELFDRKVSVLVGTPPADYVSLNEVVEIRDLRVAFDVVKTLEKEPNTATIQISNAAPASRSALHRKGARVVLQAGYGPVARPGPFRDPFGTVDVLFVGDIVNSVTSREGTDWVTVLQVSDGSRLLRNARVSVGYKGPVDMKQIFFDVGKKLLAREVDLSRAVSDVSTQLQAGFVAHGPAAEALDTLAKTAKLEWSIQDGRLQVLKRGGVSNGPVVRVAPDSGLVGAVELGSSEATEKAGKRVLKFTSLLQPGIRPGGRVELEVAGRSGLYRALKVEHEGDTHGGAWYTKVEAAEL